MVYDYNNNSEKPKEPETPIGNITPTVSTDASKNTSPNQEAKPPKIKHRTWGNIIYDGIYPIFAWGGVAGASALSAHESMHGKNKYFNWLRSLNDNCIKGFSKFFGATFLKGKSPDLIHKWAKGTTMFVTLGLGGWLMMLPIKWLEDNRQVNACRIDNALGTTPPDPETIEKEPHQTLKSVVGGRFISWGTSYAAFVAMGPHLTEKINNWCGKKFTNMWMKMRPKSNPHVVGKWADIAAFDALFTIITATMTYGFSRYIARRDDEKHEAAEIAAHLHDNNIQTSAPTSNSAQTLVLDSDCKPRANQYKTSKKIIRPRDESHRLQAKAEDRETQLAIAP